VNELWFKADQVGFYRGQCAELCGRDHGFMPVVVEVKSKEEYATWLAAQQGGEPAPAQAAKVNDAATAVVAKAE
jgi:cytochrome c oxidase subunit 2